MRKEDYLVLDDPSLSVMTKLYQLFATAKDSESLKDYLVFTHNGELFSCLAGIDKIDACQFETLLGKRVYTQKSTVKKGRYRHFKGNEYVVHGVAHDIETMKEFVVYQACYGENAFYLRSVSMFLETVERGGEVLQRFEFFGDI